MKKQQLIFFLLLFAKSSNAQVFKHYDKIVSSNDSTFQVQYFKTIYASLQNKLDSFIELIKLKAPIDTGYIYIGFRDRKTNNKRIAHFSYDDDYFNFGAIADKQNPYYSVLCFSFYKNYLVVFTLNSKTIRTITPISPLFVNILFQQMSKRVQDEIEEASKTYMIDFHNLSKRYFFDD